MTWYGWWSLFMLLVHFVLVVSVDRRVLCWLVPRLVSVSTAVGWQTSSVLTCTETCICIHWCWLSYEFCADLYRDLYLYPLLLVDRRVLRWLVPRLVYVSTAVGCHTSSALTCTETCIRIHCCWLTDEFCADLYRDLQKSDGSRIIWTFLKPLIRGRILFTPDTPTTRAILKDVSGDT